MARTKYSRLHDPEVFVQFFKDHAGNTATRYGTRRVRQCWYDEDPTKLPGDEPWPPEDYCAQPVFCFQVYLSVDLGLLSATDELTDPDKAHLIERCSKLAEHIFINLTGTHEVIWEFYTLPLSRPFIPRLGSYLDPHNPGFLIGIDNEMSWHETALQRRDALSDVSRGTGPLWVNFDVGMPCQVPVTHPPTSIEWPLLRRYFLHPDLREHWIDRPRMRSCLQVWRMQAGFPKHRDEYWLTEEEYEDTPEESLYSATYARLHCIPDLLEKEGDTIYEPSERELRIEEAQRLRREYSAREAGDSSVRGNIDNLALDAEQLGLEAQFEISADLDGSVCVLSTLHKLEPDLRYTIFVPFLHQHDVTLEQAARTFCRHLVSLIDPNTSFELRFHKPPEATDGSILAAYKALNLPANHNGCLTSSQAKLPLSDDHLAGVWQGNRSTLSEERPRPLRNCERRLQPISSQPTILFNDPDTHPFEPAQDCIIIIDRPDMADSHVSAVRIMIFGSGVTQPELSSCSSNSAFERYGEPRRRLENDYLEMECWRAQQLQDALQRMTMQEPNESHVE